MDISDLFKKLPAEITDPNRQKYSTSGVALIEFTEKGSTLLVCHDNKKQHDPKDAPPSPRFGVVTLYPSGMLKYDSLQWPKGNPELPEDLEGLSRFPCSEQLSFLGLESRGRLFYIEISKVPVSESYTISKAEFIENLVELSRLKIGAHAKNLEMQLEGFSVQRLPGAPQDKLLGVWAHRGDDKVPQGVIFWGAIDLRSRKFSCSDWYELVVPWPRTELTWTRNGPQITYARQISGLRVLQDGRLLIASALDPGDDGPFLGAVYNAGRFGFANGKYHFEACQGLKLTQVFKIEKPGHKIEGMEELGDPLCKLVMVTDDEILGPSIAIVDTPKPQN